MTVLSISSRVALGHVGNAGAAFCLQRLGHRVLPLDTTLLSNHLGYPGHGGRLLEAAEVAALLQGLDAAGALADVDALLSGYLGRAAAVAVQAVERVRALRAAALYALDPVLGERAGGLYASEAAARIVAERLLPMADLLFPNMFELDHLAGGTARSLEDILAAADRLRARGRPGLVVVVTGVDRAGQPPDMIEMLAAGPEAAWLVQSKRRALRAHGTGDCLAALFLGHYRNGRGDVAGALQRSAGAVAAIVAATGEAAELDLVAAQDRLAGMDGPEPVKIR